MNDIVDRQSVVNHVRQNQRQASLAKTVSLQSVSKRFGKVQALETMSLTIGAGQLVSLLGPSGCGKTTTLRLIAGFETPDTGNIIIGEKSVLHLPPDRRELGMVFQNYSLFPHLDVAQNIAFGLRMARVPRSQQEKRVQHMLELIQLQDYGSRRISQLSGGQQQRVALARALATNPSVLLLDEPLGALDKNLREGMQDELRSLQKQFGITSVLVTHDQDEALTMSDSIVVMNQGQILQIGSPREIYDFPHNRFVAEFLGTANIFYGRRLRYDDANMVMLLLGKDGEGFTEVTVPRPSWDTGTSSLWQLAIRPEKIRLTSADSGLNDVSGASEEPASKGCCMLDGKVIGHRFGGAQHVYTVALDNVGLTLKISQHAESDVIWPVGSHVSCYLNAIHLVVLNDPVVDSTLPAYGAQA